MLKKSQFFYFLTSLTITFVVGFFIWNVFSAQGGPASGWSKAFSASLSSSATENIVPVPDVQPDYQVQPDENPSEEGYSDGLVTISPQAISVEDQLDDIQEKLDIIKAKVQELIDEQKAADELADQEKDQEKDKDQEDEKTKENTSCVGQINLNTASVEDLDKITGVGSSTAQKIIPARPFYSLNDLLKVSGIGQATLQKIIEQGCAFVEAGLTPPLSGGGGGDGGTTTYPKILISEVQIAGVGDQKEEFVELYNQNSENIDLTNWYLQKKTSSGTVSYFDKKSLFSGKEILANSYLLIAREGYFTSLVDIATDEALSSDSS